MSATQPELHIYRRTIMQDGHPKHFVQFSEHPPEEFMGGDDVYLGTISYQAYPIRPKKHFSFPTEKVQEVAIELSRWYNGRYYDNPRWPELDEAERDAYMAQASAAMHVVATQQLSFTITKD